MLERELKLSAPPIFVLPDLAGVVDGVTVLHGRRVAARFREIEAELRPGAAEWVLVACEQRLTDAGATVEEPVPKLVRAIGPQAFAPPDVVVPELKPRPSAGDIVRRAF